MFIIKIFFLLLLIVFSKSSFAMSKHDIIVNGNIHTDKEAIISIIDKYVDNLSNDNINLIIKTLKETGSFQNISVEKTNDQLIILVKEYKKIKNISFSGNKRFKYEELINFINTEKFLIYYNDVNIRQYINELNELYLSYGYNQIDIDYNISNLDNLDFVDINIKIQEGKISKINKINFIGNNAYTNQKLKGLIKSKQTNFLKFYSNSNFKLFEAKNDIIRLREFYVSNGFRDININLKNEFIQNMNKFNLYFYITEGKKYYFNSFDVNLELENIDNKLIQNVDKIILDNTIKKKNQKSPYNRSIINTLKGKITKKLFEKGYKFFQVQSFEKKLDDGFIDILFNIIPVEPKYISQINISGNYRTLDEVIRRELLVAEGDPINDVLISDSNKNLQKLDIFKKIEIKEVYVNDQNIDLDISVEEKQTGDFQVGLSFGTLDGATFVTGLNERNINGAGRTINFTLNNSEYNTLYSLYSVEPYVFGKNIDFIYGVNYSEKDLSTTSSYNLDKFQIKSGFEYDLAKNLSHTIILVYDLKDYQVTDVNKVSSTVLDSSGTNAEINLNNKFKLNKLDSYLRPTKGNFLSFENIFSPSTNSNNGYITNIINHKKYINLNKNNIFSIQSKLGNIYSMQNKSILSDNKFSLGGRWLRGFDSFGVGPRKSASSYIGGNNILVSKLDYIRPINNNSDNPIDLNLFLDAGKVWGNKSTVSFSKESFRSSYGVGLRFYSPIGPIGFTWGFPLQDETYDIKRMFIFSIGNLN